MPIVAASVVPHSPLLLPSIAKQHAGLFSQTTDCLTTLAADWYAAKPDTVIILSPHGLPKSNDLVIHSAEQYSAGFDEFGDMTTKITANGDVAMMHQLKSAAEREHLIVPLQTFEQLDYGTGVPLSFVVAAQPQLPLCSILIGAHLPDQLLRLAAILHDFCTSDRRRYLIIASCDMTRRGECTPDMRRRPSAEERAFSSSIVVVDPAPLSAYTPQATTCGYGPLLVLVSMLNGLAKSGTILSFEAPLGVGLLTASFSLNG